MTHPTRRSLLTLATLAVLAHPRWRRPTGPPRA
jgi:hypothetical protein